MFPLEHRCYQLIPLHLKISVKAIHIKHTRHIPSRYPGLFNILLFFSFLTLILPAHPPALCFFLGCVCVCFVCCYASLLWVILFGHWGCCVSAVSKGETNKNESSFKDILASILFVKFISGMSFLTMILVIGMDITACPSRLRMVTSLAK